MVVVVFKKRDVKVKTQQSLPCKARREGGREWNYILRVRKYECHFDGLCELGDDGKGGEEGAREGREDVDKSETAQIKKKCTLNLMHIRLYLFFH